MSAHIQPVLLKKTTTPAPPVQPGEHPPPTPLGVGHPGDKPPGGAGTTTTAPLVVQPLPTVTPAADVNLPQVSHTELAVGALALVMWFVFFGGGVLVSTEPYRGALTSTQGFFPILGSAVLVLSFWTITNVGILCCISAFLGAVGRRTRFAVKAHVGRADGYADRWPGPPAPLAAHYASAIMRGFGIYGVVMAGLLVLATETFTNTTQGGYFRLASTVSVLSFYAGYDPELFASVLDRVKTLVGPPANKVD